MTTTLQITQKRDGDQILFYAPSKLAGAPLAQVAVLMDGCDSFWFEEFPDAAALFSSDSAYKKEDYQQAFEAAGLDVAAARLIDSMPNRECDVIEGNLAK